MPSGLLSLIARCMIVPLFFISVSGKLANPAGTIAYIAQNGLPVPTIAYYVAVAVELGGCLAFLLGYQTRLVSLIIVAYCLATAVGVHYHPGVAAQMTNFWKNVAIAGGLLHFASTGAGALSLDELFRRRRPATA